jgi:hypothetical protein
MGKPRSELYGIPVREIARICQVDLSTARRWRRGAICPPETAILVLRLRYFGDLGVIASDWDGWTYHDGSLISPDGWRIDRNDALAVPLLHGQIQALRQKLEGLEATRDGLEEQPAPGDIPAIVG